MKKIYFDLKDAYFDLMKEAEGVGFPGWICPVWAEIENDELKLALGAPVSIGTTFIDSDGKTSLDWVGNVECWQFSGTPEDFEEYGLESPEDFEDYREQLIESEIERSMRWLDYQLENLEEEIKAFCESEGYEVEFI